MLTFIARNGMFLLIGDHVYYSCPPSDLKKCIFLLSEVQ